MINNSLEWAPVEAKLLAQTAKLTHGREVKKMILNIGASVSELSKAEVEARQGRRYRAEHLLKQINQDIEIVEEFLLVAALIG